jgi:hypothetical protein
MTALTQQQNEAYEAIAHAYMNDPACAECRADELLWAVTIGDGLKDEPPYDVPLKEPRQDTTNT